MASKLAKLRCDRLLLAYPANFSVLILVFVSFFGKAVLRLLACCAWGQLPLCPR